MNLTLIDLVRDLVGLSAGVVIGLAFGTLQQTAQHRDEAPSLAGPRKGGWTLLPSPLVRLVFLLSTLGLIRLTCPQLFTDSTRWIISLGVLLGYGALLLGRLRQRLRNAPR